LIELAFLSGSSQIGSANWRIPAVAADLTKQIYGDEVAVTVVELSEFGLPTYSESGKDSQAVPSEVVELRNRLSNADGVFISSDEYTGAYSAVLKNTLRWLSALKLDNEAPLADMPTALCGTSSRGVGALRGQPALAQLLNELGARVISQYLELGTAPSLFDERGRLHKRFEKQLVDGCLFTLIEAGKNRQLQRYPTRSRLGCGDM
jgi:NAD(P)H-dependent FMN reductase